MFEFCQYELASSRLSRHAVAFAFQTCQPPSPGQVADATFVKVSPTSRKAARRGPLLSPG